MSTDDASSCITVSHKKSRRRRGAHSQPSFEAETETLIRDYDLKLRQVAQGRVLSKSMHTLEGLFENLSIQPMPFSNGLELCNTSNLEAASPRSVPQTYASGYDDTDGEIPRSRHVTSSMPTAEESTTGALGELWVSVTSKWCRYVTNACTSPDLPSSFEQTSTIYSRQLDQ